MGIHTHRMSEDENETTPIDANDDGEAGAVNVDNEVEEIQQLTETLDAEDTANGGGAICPKTYLY